MKFIYGPRAIFITCSIDVFAESRRDDGALYVARLNTIPDVI